MKGLPPEPGDGFLFEGALFVGSGVAPTIRHKHRPPRSTASAPGFSSGLTLGVTPIKQTLRGRGERGFTVNDGKVSAFKKDILRAESNI